MSTSYDRAPEQPPHPGDPGRRSAPHARPAPRPGRLPVRRPRPPTGPAALRRLARAARAAGQPAGARRPGAAGRCSSARSPPRARPRWPPSSCSAATRPRGATRSARWRRPAGALVRTSADGESRPLDDGETVLEGWTVEAANEPVTLRARRRRGRALRRRRPADVQRRCAPRRDRPTSPPPDRRPRRPHVVQPRGPRRVDRRRRVHPHPVGDHRRQSDRRRLPGRLPRRGAGRRRGGRPPTTAWR